MAYNTMSDEQRELFLYVQNTGTIWTNRVEPTFRNYQRKQKRGNYDSALAVKGLRYAVDEAARMYAHEFSIGTDWSTMFRPADRQVVATELRDYFEAEIAAGNSWL